MSKDVRVREKENVGVDGAEVPNTAVRVTPFEFCLCHRLAVCFGQIATEAWFS